MNGTGVGQQAHLTVEARTKARHCEQGVTAVEHSRDIGRRGTGMPTINCTQNVIQAALAR